MLTWRLSSSARLLFHLASDPLLLESPLLLLLLAEEDSVDEVSLLEVLDKVERVDESDEEKGAMPDTRLRLQI